MIGLPLDRMPEGVCLHCLNDDKIRQTTVQNFQASLAIQFATPMQSKVDSCDCAKIV